MFKYDYDYLKSVSREADAAHLIAHHQLHKETDRRKMIPCELLNTSQWYDVIVLLASLALSVTASKVSPMVFILNDISPQSA